MTQLDLVTDEVLDFFLGIWLNSNVLLEKVGHPSNYNLSKKFLQLKVYDLIKELGAQESDLAKEYFRECENKKNNSL